MQNLSRHLRDYLLCMTKGWEKRILVDITTKKVITLNIKFHPGIIDQQDKFTSAVKGQQHGGTQPII